VSDPGEDSAKRDRADDAWADLYAAPATPSLPPGALPSQQRDSRRIWQVVILTLIGIVLALDWWRMIDNIGNGVPDVFRFGWFMLRILVSIGYLVYLRRVL
jgi:hypothetical protein